MELLQFVFLKKQTNTKTNSFCDNDLRSHKEREREDVTPCY